MKKQAYKFSSSSVHYYFSGSIAQLKKIGEQRHSILVTDEHVFEHHKKRLKGWNTIILKSGEEFKVQATADALIDQLIAMQADRKTLLIGVGGGVITDLTGYVASVFMRGIPFGFVPTTLLGMVDASIGGKNGIDVGVYKNMVGVIRQPQFILYDMNFLDTLPQREWENGFAEIIKHAAIKDARMFRELEQNSFKKYRSSKHAIGDLVKRNALIKTRVVQQDEFEKGERRLLNFGHTLAHALENRYTLPHGRAVAIGMSYAAVISEKLTGFKDAARLASLILKYDLPTFTAFDIKQVIDILKMDKKREKEEMNYVLLEKIGKGVVKSIPLKQLESIIQNL